MSNLKTQLLIILPALSLSIKVFNGIKAIQNSKEIKERLNNIERLSR